MKNRAGLLMSFLHTIILYPIKSHVIGSHVITSLAILSLAVIVSGCAKKEEGPVDAAQQTEQETVENEISQAEETQKLVFEGVDIEGNQISSTVFSEAKITMINVWATYCNPCLREMPGLGELTGDYDAGEFQIIGIISDVLEGGDQKAIDQAKDLITQTNAQYPHLLLNESVYYALLTDVSVVPTTFFIDENGVVLDTVMGAMDKAAWKEKIDELLGKE